MKNQNEQGMSLLEMLVVMALVAILTAGGIQSWQGVREAQRLRQGALALQTFLGRVQAQANAANDTRLLWVEEGARGCVTTQPPPPAGCGTASAALYPAARYGVTVQAFSGNGMGFYGLRNTAQPGHITLRNGAGHIRVVLSGQGRLRLCSEDNLSGVPPCR